jgi:hypothetical protein
VFPKSVEFRGPLNATRLVFHSVSAVELVDKAALIEFFHELSIDQVFRLQARHGGEFAAI